MAEGGSDDRPALRRQVRIPVRHAADGRGTGNEVHGMGIFLPTAIIGVLALLFGLGLAYASKVFEVKVDERVVRVREALPGANCGACGFSGCDAMAEAVVMEGVKPSRCPVGGQAMVSDISEIMGLSAESTVPVKARVLCQGTWHIAQTKYVYDGIEDCAAATRLLGGMSACVYGCVGMGSCRRACQFDAIEVEDGLARIVPEKCTSCGQCVEACPKGIIRMLPVTGEHTVQCSNHERGNISRTNCQRACIACTKCVKTCPVGAIAMKDQLAVIDPAVCTNCGQCVEVCPMSCITRTTVGARMA